jgi:hypothetical protein
MRFQKTPTASNPAICSWVEPHEATGLSFPAIVRTTDQSWVPAFAEIDSRDIEI